MDIIQNILNMVWARTEKLDTKRIASQSPTPGIAQICDIHYIDDSERGHLLDIYYPAETKKEDKLPVIIDIHGGGWMYGYKEINKYFCLKLAQKGFLVVNLNYRLANSVLFCEQIKDIFAAFNWLSDNLRNYPADTENVFLVGDSAGGHFASVSVAVCVNKDFQRDFEVNAPAFEFKAVGAISPAIDLISPNFMMNVQLKMLLGENFKQSKFYKYMDYKNLADFRLPPFYIVTSDGDFIQKQAYKLKKVLTEYNVENIFENYTDKINGKKLPHVFGVVDPYSEPASRFISTMTEFFKSKMKETADK